MNIIQDKRVVYTFLTILWMVVIFVFSSQNGEVSNLNNTFIVNTLKKLGINLVETIPDINLLIRKSAHLTEYLILGILLFKTYSFYLSKSVNSISILTGFLYACSDEIHQYFVPGRAAAVSDVLIDTTGVVVGVIIILIVCRTKVNKLRMHRI